MKVCQVSVLMVGGDQMSLFVLVQLFKHSWASLMFMVVLILKNLYS